MIHTIDTLQDFEDLKTYVNDNKYLQAKVSLSSGVCSIQFENHETFQLNLTNFSFSQKNAIHSWLKPFREYKEQPPVNDQDVLIYGKDSTKNVVSIEAKDDQLELFIEENGVVRSEFRPNKFWLLSSRKFDASWSALAGNLHYKYIKHYQSKKELWADKNKYRMADLYSIANEKEAAMVTQGITYFKGMKVDDVSRFHFDLETIGLIEAKNHKILCISTSYVKKNEVKKRLFALDEYESEGAMIEAFCAYLRECNPSVVSGFNIFGFDFPYLQLCADNNGVELSLGRDESNIRFDKYTSKFRKDGSQDYDYTRCHIYGREIVDMMFVAYHFDFARKYERYALKSIIEQEGLTKEGRTFYPADKIRENWDNPEERAKIKAYCMDDSDDSESLYKLMISSYFYFTQHIPKSFQTMNYSATGSQLNSFLVRSYLQEGHSIPKADEAVKFLGAISDGFAGVYRNVLKVDVSSLYPSVMIQYEVSDKDKDPKDHFLKMVKYFTEQRLADKKKAKETGDRYYEELEQSRKIAINSAYGLLGAHGLNFNFPSGAAMVTEKGREILKIAIKWCSGVDYVEKTKGEEHDTNPVTSVSDAI
jgi:DNA polymerase, archaea type